MALYKQASRPLSSLVLLLCGIPILLGAGRSHFLGAAIAFALSAGYYLLDVLFTSLGDRGDLPVLFAAWLPLAALLSLGVARLRTVPT
jgi:lipopolysaccharide export LptBFGC system permease protein LptF